MSDESRDPPESVQEVMDAHGYTELTQTQEIALEQGILEGGNHLLIARTGNGKTLCAEAKVKETVENGGRVAYLVPSNQLKSAKYEELDEWAEFDILVSGQHKDAFKLGDVVVATFEGFYQQALQHPARVNDIDLAVLDDFHYLYDSYRGFTLEKAITALKREDIDILAMSASIGGAKNVADWMDAHLMESFEDRRIPIEENVVMKDGGQQIREQVADYIVANEDGAPWLVFNKSRRAAESCAKKVAEKRGWNPDPDATTFDQFKSGTEIGSSDNRPDLATVKDEIEEEIGSITDELEQLANLIRWGVSYHHAGLPRELREYIEQLYVEGKIDCLSITTTLGSGYDAPVKTVFVADYQRWTRESGTEKIGVWEYEQWVGRAGRPGYGYDRGNAAILASSESDVEEYLAPRELEPIESHVRKDELLRKYLLELIATGHSTQPEIESFIDNTLWVNDANSVVWGVEYDPYDTVEDAVKWLTENEFVERTGTGFRTTALGKATVNYGFRQFGRYSLIGVRNLHDWLNEQDSIEQLELLNAICDYQNIQLYNSDSQETAEEFASQLRENGLDPEEDSAKTAGVLLRYWCENRDLEAAANHSGMRAEFTASTARQVHDVLSLIPDVIETIPGLTVPSWYPHFKLQIRYGVREEEAQLTHEVKGLGRKRVRELRTFLHDSELDLSGGLRSQVKQLVEDRGEQAVVDFIADGKRPYGIGTEISSRIVDAVAD